MPLAALPTGLPAVADDLRAWALAVHLERPTLLGLLAVPVAVAVLRRLTARRRRLRLARIGDPAAVDGLVTAAAKGGWRLPALAGLGWLGLAVGAAGPAWGPGDPGAAVGRDVVLVLDLSRSMLAEDMLGPPQRWKAAVAGALDLFAAGRGGDRVGVVVFASRPMVLVPLTADGDHLRSAVALLDGANPPAETRPGPAGSVSGTRIGAALSMAVRLHDPRSAGAQDIILVSDGDDPAGDREWAAGVSAARLAGIPVHAAGVGDPNRDSGVSVLGKTLDMAGGEPVRTRLREDVLREITTEGRGEYLSSRRSVPQLGEFLGRVATGTRDLADRGPPRPRDRSAWFLAAAAILFTVGRVGGRSA